MTSSALHFLKKESETNNLVSFIAHNLAASNVSKISDERNSPSLDNFAM
ncbi:uncharacterized protein METZ01_LOCUS75774 [marine metagenome]|uniref:Uncharacterized protein n=1 Tax=marine metagenome TaxID=408172 RepID=A0A381U3U6_9ZZZZ